MKRILDIWTKMAVAVAVLTGGMTSCSDGDDGVRPEDLLPELANQMRYNLDITDIKSVVWERNNEGAYVVYLSPKERVNSIAELGSDCMKVETKNIGSFDVKQDVFRLTYKTFDINEKTADAKTAVMLSLKLDPQAGTFNIDGDVRTIGVEESMAVKYDGAARRLMPAVAENEVNVNGEKFALNYSAWKRNAEGVYTFFVAPDEQSADNRVISIEMKNPMNFDLSKDAFTLKYDNIELNEKSLKTGYSKLDVRFGFDPATAQFAMKVEALSEKGDAFTASYSGAARHMRPEAADNAIVLNNESTAINSVVWEMTEDGMYHICLSPRKGLVTYEELIKENDYMMITVAEANGALKGQFEISFKDMTLNAGSQYLDREINVLLQDGKLTMKIYALLQDGNEMNAAYEGTVEKIRPMELHNQWQIDRGTIETIASAVEWRSGNLVNFYLCNKSGVETPESIADAAYVRISVPKGYANNIDLAGNTEVKIVCGDLATESAKEIAGTLNISKNDLHKSVTIRMDATIDGRRLRADWTGVYAVGYDSANNLKIELPDKTVREVALSTVFINSTKITNAIAFGTKENPTDVNSLKEGFAIQVNVTSLENEIVLEESKDYRVQLFDYTNYVTCDSSKGGMTGTLNTWSDGKGMVYFLLRASIEGFSINAEWYGKVTDAEAFDLTPVKPFRPNFKIIQENGDVAKDETVIELQVREDPNYQSNVSGARMDAYVFYFVNRYTAAGGIDDVSATPVLAINKSCVGQGEIDITKGEALFDFKYLAFNNMGIASPSNYTGTTDKGTLLVTKEGDDWTISFSVLDYGNWYGWGGSSGSKATFTAEWKGKGTPYHQ